MIEQHKIDVGYLQDGACRKYRQLVQEIEKMPGGRDRENLLHSAYKLGEFLRTSLGDIWKLPNEETT